MTFGKALQILKDGGFVRRHQWAVSGMWLCYIEGRTRKSLTKPCPQYETGLALNNQAEAYIEINAHIDIRMADGSMQPGWTPTQADMLASDWEPITKDNLL